MDIKNEYEYLDVHFFGNPHEGIDKSPCKFIDGGGEGDHAQNIEELDKMFAEEEGIVFGEDSSGSSKKPELTPIIEHFS